ncbi:MAG: SAM-dependent methyltransferase [Bdellovibrionaceae bacterium]|nr:SAM-dependent methyltransferase [Pseudobdellovibrionaceae bacterium]
MIRLSPRLQFLLDQAWPGEALWDLCCDHGLLGRRALQSGRFPEVHFVDQVPHIMARLRERLTREAPGAPAFLHAVPAGDLEPVLTGTVIIAGVGGEKILEILRRLHERRRLQARRLVLSPHKDEEFLAESLACDFASQWRLSPPRHVHEGPRVRPVWVAEAL